MNFTVCFWIEASSLDLGYFKSVNQYKSIEAASLEELKALIESEEFKKNYDYSSAYDPDVPDADLTLHYETIFDDTGKTVHGEELALSEAVYSLFKEISTPERIGCKQTTYYFEENCYMSVEKNDDENVLDIRVVKEGVFSIPIMTGPILDNYWAALSNGNAIGVTDFLVWLDTNPKVIRKNDHH